MSDTMTTLQLLQDAAGPCYHWSRIPGKFVSKSTGEEWAFNFSGTVREWYETLVEVIIDVAHHLPESKANIVVAHPDAAMILECSVLFRLHLGDVDHDPLPATAEKDGEMILTNQVVVYKDPTLPRNRILVGCCGEDGALLSDPSSRGTVTVLDLLP